LRESKRKDFVERIVKEIKGKWQYFRIHASGDFYSEEYVEKWIEIAQQCPDTIFKAFTKREDLTDSLQRLAALPNVKLRQSLDETKQDATMGLEVGVIEYDDLNKAGMMVCPQHCPTCGYKCWHKTESVVWHAH
jgi:hypothetical protein